jgi:hypothetical protein
VLLNAADAELVHLVSHRCDLITRQPEKARGFLFRTDLGQHLNDEFHRFLRIWHKHVLEGLPGDLGCGSFIGPHETPLPCLRPGSLITCPLLPGSLPDLLDPSADSVRQHLQIPAQPLAAGARARGQQFRLNPRFLLRHRA